MAESMLSEAYAPHTIYLKDYQAPQFFIDDIELKVDLYDDHALVTSQLIMRRNRHGKENSGDLFLHGENLELQSIALEGKALPKEAYIVSEHGLTVKGLPDNFQLQIVCKTYPHKNTALSGLYCSRGTFCTQCEAQGFRRITYYLDQPDVLARFVTTITADKKRYPTLLSNGNLIDSGDLPNDRHFATWQDPFKKPSYLFALVAGDFDLLAGDFKTQSGRMIDLRVYVEKGYGDQAGHALYSLQEAMRWDETAYGREYDLDTYMIVAISDFNMGAMENKGLNIFNTKYILAKPETATDQDYIHILSVVGHEYFHNWSGNRVTCRDWFQLSLKEGLTIFRDQSFSEDVLSHAVMRIHSVNDLRETQFPEDAGPLAHPVRPESYIEINNFYTSTVYNKGAEVLRMLRTILGPVLFRKGMDLYFARHDGQAVTIEDYVKTMEDVSGIDLTQFRLWYAQSGTPCVMVDEVYDAAAKTYTLSFDQACPPTPNQDIKAPFHVPVRMGLLDAETGEPLPLQIGEEDFGLETVLHFTKTHKTYTFKNVAKQPIPSLFRDFSAPVKWQFNYKDSALEFLFKHDQDPFNRWEAGQQYAVRQLLRLVGAYQQKQALVFPEEWATMMRYALEHADQDALFLSELLMIPSEKYVAEQMDVIDVDAIHAAREFVLSELSARLEPLWLSVYKSNQDNSAYEFTMLAVGKRQLKNRALAYLLQLPQHAELGWKQFEAALKTNMTDTQAALVGLAIHENPYRAKALEAFYNAWQHDALVVDKWLSIQAVATIPNELAEMQRLVKHPAFDLKNPNKVYSLIGAFGQRNAITFHAQDGSGYVFLREILAQLDKINPQVAARMVKPLTSLKRYDKERQSLMRQQLEVLRRDQKLSKDLYELVTKSLE